MEDIRKTKNIHVGKLLVISVVVIMLFTVGFLSGVSLLYGLTSTEINDLHSQIEHLQDNEIGDGIDNISYFYNDTSLSSLYNDVKDSIVVVYGIVTYQSFFGKQYSEVQGSGFVYEINENMVVITNNHVVSDASNIVVTFSNGNSYNGEVLGSDPYSDLAVLTVDAPLDEFRPLDIVSSSSLEVGDPVIAIGNPMGLDGTMTTGIVSQIGRTIEESLAGSFPIANIIQTSVAINPGNSGGPLFNYQGAVVGITTAIIEDSEGLGFAIPSNTILKEIESLVETGGYTEHSWLGVSGVDMSYYIADIMNINVTYGWLITSVSSGSSAGIAGLQAGTQQVRVIDEWVVTGGDIIISIDGQRIVSGDALMSYLEEHTQPSQTVVLTVFRDNQTIDLPVSLGTRPSIM
jgi:S1-C subfamily serine protease